MRFLPSLPRGSFLWSLLRAAWVMLGKRWRSISRTIDLGSVVPEALFRRIDIRWSTRLLWKHHELNRIKSRLEIQCSYHKYHFYCWLLVFLTKFALWFKVSQYFISQSFISHYFTLPVCDVLLLRKLTSSRSTFQGSINCRRWCRWALPWLAPGSR